MDGPKSYRQPKVTIVDSNLTTKTVFLPERPCWKPDFFTLAAKNWFQPELVDGYATNSAMAFMRRRNFLEWLGIPGPTPHWRETDNITWNGSHLQINSRALGMMAHEIGHWIVASPVRRRLPDFGLGELSNDPNVLFNLPYERCLEEHCAVLMGTAVCDALGIPEVIVGAVNFTGWESVGRDQWCRDAFHWLCYRKLLSAGGHKLTGDHRTWEDGAEAPTPVNLILADP